MSDDLRADDETRGELHQRVDDLRERLWSICDDRKDQAEREREDIINDGWLDDHIGLLTNIYITLSQAEVDRFQDTVRVLKDYYRGMEGKTPDSTVAAEYPRLPLVEVSRMGYVMNATFCDDPLSVMKVSGSFGGVAFTD